MFVFLRQTLAVAEAEVRKLRHDPMELLTRAIQPLLWLVVFGRVFGRLREIPTGQLSYLDFMAPGILAQSVLFIAIFYGISVIWERDLGILHKFLVSPASRVAAATLAPRRGPNQPQSVGETSSCPRQRLRLRQPRASMGLPNRTPIRRALWERRRWRKRASMMTVAAYQRQGWSQSGSRLIVCPQPRHK